ncbi:UDP-3-O-(3-hydroxymyristoyl)glucosamine N-acyltransferase [uncultured Clostridium sp.]|uniref:UDP-3-O-(3-hydroxymyristoyl)glucosamine N-acyltransferase n=1 Tax=uncultured Clostridium sp. TaxID=59620 RepID=UPI002588AB4F|nr:UDP-3-O-(3-hydroxymyristoyl)glucosamine N-acyltransferase [uncultured Clostridium sp.]
MLLSEVVELIEGLNLLKDEEFTSLGLAVAKCDEKILTFVENEKYINSLSDKVVALITTEEIGEKLKENYGIIISDNPRANYFKLHNKLSNIEGYRRKDFDALIDESCKISKLASISDKNVIIGKNVIVEEFVVIRENTIIGDNSIIRSGVVLGGEGYEYKRFDGIIMNVNHCGGVIIENNVEVQYNSCIDKALYPWDNTIIGEYSKLDNLVHIEHGVKVGKRCLIASRSTFGGRTIIGDDSWVGLGAIVSNGLKLGNKVSISLGSVVTKNLKDGEKVSGNFAINHEKFINFIKEIR